MCDVVNRRKKAEYAFDFFLKAANKLNLPFKEENKDKFVEEYLSLSVCKCSPRFVRANLNGGCDVL